ncbi:MAG: translocation/assembly module TamB, partial [Sphingomonadaceae bacterium]|nr:translocation/assembly module TamB [Sphingomonadaceae bacterium]
AVARLGGRPLADLALTEAGGRLVVAGSLAPAPLLDGMAARASAGGIRLHAEGQLAARVLTARVDAASPAVRASAAGTADFGHEVLAGVHVTARALQPAVLLPRLSGRDIVLDARVAGPFARPRVGYVLTSPEFAWGKTRFTAFRATGEVAVASPVVVPVAASAATVEGVGEDLGAVLARPRLAGAITVAHRTFSAAALKADSAGAAGAVSLRLTFDGDYDLGFKGVLPRYAIGGLGVADVGVDLRAHPGAGGTQVDARVDARATRVDSGLARAVLAGLPEVTSAVTVAPDLSMRFADLRLTAPGLTAAGGGTRDVNGLIHIAVSGGSRDYGAVAATLAGPIDAPTADLALAAPLPGLTAVAAHVSPDSAGWRVTAHGTTPVGPATLDARLAPGATGADLALAVAGATAKGAIVLDDAGRASGRLAIAGEGLTGALVLAPGGAAQRIDLALAASAAAIGPATLARGTLAGHIVVGSGAPLGDVRATLTDLRGGGVVVTSATLTASATAQGGTATLSAAGTAGVPFTLAVDARGSGDRAEIGGTGSIDGKPLRLDHRAAIERVGGAWRLAPVRIVTPDGAVELAGSIGDGVTASVRADNLGLSLLTVADPAFNFGGHVAGTLRVTVPSAGAPTGDLSLRVHDLTRAGLAASSLPVDFGINAALTGEAAAARAVLVQGGSTIGRAQVDLRLMPGPSLPARLLGSLLFAQARFAGPAQAVWALSGIEALDVRGPITVAVDAGGRLGDPRLSGTIAARDARVENTTLGTVVDKVDLDGRFAGSQLDLARFAGAIGKDGHLAGSGRIDLSAERGFPLDVSATLERAAIINRDDLQATATGTLRLHSDGGGGRVSGTLDVVRGRYRLGRAAAGADVPVLAVAERNADLLGRAASRPARPTQWTLDIGLTARDNFAVEGLGLNSFWRGSLKVGGRANAPDLVGRVQLIRGDYDFSGKRFELTRGDVRFAGGNPPDPVIDIAAENTSSGFTAQLGLTGTALHPDIRFSSTPALPEDEVLARVLFGSSITTLSAPEAIQLGGALASLRSNGRGVGAVLDPFNTVRKTLRVDRLRALPADTTTGRKTSIAAGKYIGRRLYVELATDAQGYSATSIEVALSRSFSILSTVATLGGTSANLRIKRDY